MGWWIGDHTRTCLLALDGVYGLVKVHRGQGVPEPIKVEVSGDS